jgi:1-acyl-sn-glycerol-3-phosphate acyltransferase
VDRAANDLSAIKASIDACQNGRVLSIFPQGHRYPGVDPKTTPTKNGAALMAYRSGCDVLPVCLNIKKCRYAPFRKIEVIFGKLIKNSALGFVNGGNDEYKKATSIIFDEIVKLGSFSALPAYDPQNDKILKKNKRKRRK